ncbi:conserved hypothetical protein [Rhodopseudomonas palustris BisB5]|uniref:DUF2946 domain-containing protein n=1 Tax=Rhodopseudomonas palustris (strain BisB5) TaxID=316057 RepID=Q131H5_RHOPS|nr:conserved hypothetical protein [Rhodopseudomonas palustris BisB5]
MGMGWVRANIRLGARLALIALALQFALSFGHFHDHDLDAPSKVIGQIAAAIAPDAPETDHHPDAAADLCAICAVVAMANTLIDAAPPALPLRHTDRPQPRIAETAAADLSPQPGEFQPRAPPLS